MNPFESKESKFWKNEEEDKLRDGVIDANNIERINKELVTEIPKESLYTFVMEYKPVKVLETIGKTLSFFEWHKKKMNDEDASEDERINALYSAVREIRELRNCAYLIDYEDGLKKFKELQKGLFEDFKIKTKKSKILSDIPTVFKSKKSEESKPKK